MSIVIECDSAPAKRSVCKLLPWLSVPISAMCVGTLAIAADDPRQNLEEVIVTAQKRAERLQETPISISVLRGGDLDRYTVQGVVEALGRVPGIAAASSPQGGGTQIAIRGVAAGGPLFNGSSPIAYYLDSLPVGLVKTAIVPDTNAYDLERIEVLRGPQGTLYGASALNGVVRVLTRDADLNEFAVKARTSLSSTERAGENYRGDMAINVPIVSGKVAARAVGGYEKLGGWVDTAAGDNVNDAEIWNARLKVNAQPTDGFSIALSGWLSRADFGAPSMANDSGRRVATLDEPITANYDLYGATLKYESSRFAITSVTGYLDYENTSSLDLLPLGLANTPIFTGLYSKVISQELIATSTSGEAWRWSIGAMYRDAQDRLLQLLRINPAPIDFGDSSKSVAFFGEITRVLLNGHLELTAGLRHFEDEVTQEENVRHTGVSTQPLFHARDTFEADSPRLVLTWLPSESLTVYASYAEGFRSGFNQNANVIAAAPNFPPLHADNLSNYELGAKGNLGDVLSYDAAIYYIDWKDVQQTVAVIGANGIPFTALINGESASGAGLEFSVSARPSEHLQLGVNFSWSDLVMDADVFSRGVLLFKEGDRLNLSPEYTAGVSADYRFTISEGGFDGRISASANYTDEQSARTVAGTTPRLGIGDSLLVARTSLSINSVNGWTATLFVDNVSGEDGAVSRQPSGALDWSPRIRPRTVGLQLEYSFE